MNDLNSEENIENRKMKNSNKCFLGFYRCINLFSCWARIINYYKEEDGLSIIRNIRELFFQQVVLVWSLVPSSQNYILYDSLNQNFLKQNTDRLL